MHYEKRYIVKHKELKAFSLFEERNRKTLLESLSTHKKIVLLGNPGTGKTTELNNLFNVLLEDIERSGIVPFYISLKYFRKNSRFEDLINVDNWNELPQIVFILDGLDEIVDILDFISELGLFISKNSTLNISFVVSCRTNIYDRYLVQIPGFELFSLEPLTFDQAKSILKNNFSWDITDSSLENEIYNNINTPFFLKLLGDYYRDKGKEPESKSEIWKHLVDSTIKKHVERPNVRANLNKPKLKKSLKLISVVMELMMRNYISDDELSEIFDSYYNEFKENPFFEPSRNSDNFSFTHRQIQEYFVSQCLLSLPFEQIIDFIRIESTNSVHPTIINSLTFAIDLMDDLNTFKKLTAWLQKNQLDVLIKSEPNRLKDSLRKNIFQAYFKENCLEKTLWINTNKTFSVIELAKFGDLPDNFDYLINIINEKSSHRRAKHSALELMSVMSIPVSKKSKFKVQLLDWLNENQFDYTLKSRVLNVVRNHKLYSNIQFQNRIFLILKESQSNEINRELLAILEENQEIDKYFSFIKQEFLWSTKIKKRDDDDDVIRGNADACWRLILKLKDSKKFLEMILFYLRDELYRSYSTIPEDDLLKKTIGILNEDVTKINIILDDIKKEYRFEMNDEFLLKAFIEAEVKDDVLKYLLEKRDFVEFRYVIARIITKETLDYTINKILKKNVDLHFIETFRNYMSNRGTRELAIEFDKKLRENGIEFNERILTVKETEKQVEIAKKKYQDNFDVLFDISKLKKRIKTLFKEHGKKITKEKYRSMRSDWYDKYGHWADIAQEIDLIQSTLHAYSVNEVKESDVLNFISNDINIYKRIYSKLERSRNSNWKLTVSKLKKKTIKDWVLCLSAKIDFDKVIYLHHNNSYSYLEDFDKLQLVLKFKELLNIKLPNSFLLQSIQFFDIDKHNEDMKSFLSLKNEINDDPQFDKTISDNIINRSMFSFSFSKHVNYALENKLEDTYEAIREYILEESPNYTNSNQLELYVSNTKDFKILKELAADTNYWGCWTALDILLKFDQEIDFIIEKSINYLEGSQDTFSSRALNILLITNHESLIKYLLVEIQKKKDYSLHFLTTKIYSAVKDFHDLEKMYFLFYTNKIDSYESHSAKSFFNTYVKTLSANDKFFEKVINVLNRIKHQLQKEKEDLFFINILIDDAIRSNINSKSKPFDLNKSLIKAQAII